jgi:GT2 family glycosyltransferase
MSVGLAPWVERLLEPALQPRTAAEARDSTLLDPDVGLDPFVQYSRPAVETRGTPTPRLSVVIVNYCQWKNTARLVQQLGDCDAIRSGHAEIIVVDNHSPGTRAARKLRRSPGVTVLHSEKNQGFARAANRGSRFSQGDWVLLLNPDVTVPGQFLDQVLQSAECFPAVDPRAGVIGFQLRNRDGTKQASTGPFPTFLGTLLGLFSPRSRRKCKHQSLSGRQQVPWVTGGCLLVRRDCYEQIGGLDESYFLYYEDVDFCSRAREQGWSVWYDPELRVTHHFPLHTREVPPPLRLVTRHALLTYARRHWPRWQAWCLARVVCGEARLREWLANARGQTVAASCYDQLRLLVGDLEHGRDAEAQERIRFAAAFLEDVATQHDGQTGEAASCRV